MPAERERSPLAAAETQLSLALRPGIALRSRNRNFQKRSYESGRGQPPSKMLERRGESADRAMARKRAQFENRRC